MATFEEQCKELNPDIQREDYTPSEKIKGYIKYKEGFSNTWSKSSNPTIGYGFTKEDMDALEGFNDLPEEEQILDRESADALFEDKITSTIQGIKTYNGWRGLDDNQLNSLLSYFYSSGYKNKPELKNAIEGCQYKKAMESINSGIDDSSNTKLKPRRYEEQMIWKGADPMNFIKNTIPTEVMNNLKYSILQQITEGNGHNQSSSGKEDEFINVLG